MKGIIGLFVSLILIILMISWLRTEWPKLMTPNIRSIFNIASTTTNTGSETQSPFQGHVVIASVSLGSFRSVSIQNTGVATIPLSTWKLKVGDALVAIPEGSVNGATSDSPEQIRLGLNETAVIHEGVRNEQAITLHPRANWYAWTNSQFLKTRGTIILLDASGREVATFEY